VTGCNPSRDREVAEEAVLAELFRSAPLYAILDTAVRPELSASAILEALLRAGVRVIQYRHKETLRRVHFEECCALARRTHEFGGRFFVNDRADVALLCGADGVHLGQEDLLPEKARLFLGEGMQIGFSTHTLEQARSALRAPADYIAVGPIFPTSTKKNPDPVVGLELVAQVRSLTAKPLVAIGGITLQNSAAVLQAGVNAVAVIGDLLAAPDIEARARQFLAALQQSEPRP
jgi:thiamine-phosphate pyrophosphorylase